jgi:hypothetical protein
MLVSEISKQMEKPKHTYSFKIWDTKARKWCAKGTTHSKNGKMYTNIGHARSAITNKLSGRNNTRKREEFQIVPFKTEMITMEQYEYERKNR